MLKAKKGPYNNVESKVKNYIAALPPPNNGGKRKKTFEKHTSMPGYIGECGLSEASITTTMQREHEFDSYRRQSNHTISELEKQVQVAVAMISQANTENNALKDRIVDLQKEMALANRPTPDVPILADKYVCTPKKGLHPRLVSDNTTGSFIGQTPKADGLVVDVSEQDSNSPNLGVQGKRNLSFNSSGDMTGRSGGTDSGINSSDGHDINVDSEGFLVGGLNESGFERQPKRKRIRRYIKRLICCGDPAVQDDQIPKNDLIRYKKM